MYDRTSEFVSAVETIRRYDVAKGGNGGAMPAAAVRLPPKAQLHAVSRELAREVKAAISMVATLYRLAHRKGLFDDPAAEINALTSSCKVELQRLDGRIRDLVGAVAKCRSASASSRSSTVSRPVRTVLVSLMAEAGWPEDDAERPLRRGASDVARCSVESALSSGPTPAINPLLLSIASAIASAAAASAAADLDAAGPFSSSGLSSAGPSSHGSWAAASAASSHGASTPFGSALPLPVVQSRRFGVSGAGGFGRPMPTVSASASSFGGAALSVGSSASPALPAPALPGAISPETAAAAADGAIALRRRLCPEWGGPHLPAMDASAAASAQPQGSQRSHWSSVAEVLKGRVLGATRAFQDALRIRSENLREQSERRRTLARSTWAPLVDLSSPLFAGAGALTPVAANANTPAAGMPGGGSPQPSAAAGALPGALPGNGGNSGTSGNSGSSSDPFSHSLGPVGASGARRRPNALGTAAGSGGGESGSASPSLPAGPAAAGSSALGMSGKYGRPQPATSSGYGPPGLAGTAVASYTAQQLARYHDAASRAAEMRAVESTIVELGQMFTRMASLVAEQGEMVDRIDADMAVTLDNVTEAHSQLQTYYASIMTNRGFIVKLFGVAIFVCVLVMLYKR